MLAVAAALALCLWAIPYPSDQVPPRLAGDFCVLYHKASGMIHPLYLACLTAYISPYGAIEPNECRSYQSGWGLKGNPFLRPGYIRSLIYAGMNPHPAFLQGRLRFDKDQCLVWTRWRASWSEADSQPQDWEGLKLSQDSGELSLRVHGYYEFAGLKLEVVFTYTLVNEEPERFWKEIVFRSNDTSGLVDFVLEDKMDRLWSLPMRLGD